MALMLKRIFQGYDYLMNDLADPRAEDYFLMSSPLPIAGILTIWSLFVFKLGPAYMKNRQPFNLKYIMIAYNIAQVIVNLYIVQQAWQSKHIIDWGCFEIDYSRSYWGMKFHQLSHVYFMLKLTDLIDTIFFVLRKKSRHISFLHVYHHFGMCWLGWIGTKFVGGGHAYFIGAANCIVHSILYSYYLLTAYDSKYSKLLWLKKLITQIQLSQFVFLFFSFGQILFRNECKFPKGIAVVTILQNISMLILFGNFYIQTYYVEPRKKRKQLDEKRKLQKLQEKNL